MRFQLHLIDRNCLALLKRAWGFYRFSPCSCGCTDSYGIGLQLGWFGLTVSKRGHLIKHGNHEECEGVIAKSKELCQGCREDSYNHTGRNSCQSYTKAKVVKRMLVGAQQPPPYIWYPQAVLSCCHHVGKHFLKRDDYRVVTNEEGADKWRNRTKYLAEEKKRRAEEAAQRVACD